MARIPYVDRDELPEGKRRSVDSLSGESERPEGDGEQSLQREELNVYRALAHNLDLLEQFRTYGTALWEESGLTPAEREFVILTTAYGTNSSYEWHQHVRVALREGMEREHILAISNETLDPLASKHAAVVSYVRSFVDSSVTDADHKEIVRHYDYDVLIGITQLSGLYVGLARLLDAFDIETESEFVGWRLERL